MSLLGDSLLAQKKYADAEPLLLESYEEMRDRVKNVSAGGKTELVEATKRLVRLYEALDQPERAAEWRKKLPAEPPARKD